MSPSAPRHVCPAPGCTVMVVQAQLACRTHWYSIPPEIRSRVWAGYRSLDPERHGQALRDAVSFLKAQESPSTA